MSQSPSFQCLLYKIWLINSLITGHRLRKSVFSSPINDISLFTIIDCTLYYTRNKAQMEYQKYSLIWQVSCVVLYMAIFKMATGDMKLKADWESRLSVSNCSYWDKILIFTDCYFIPQGNRSVMPVTLNKFVLDLDNSSQI